MGRNLPDGDFFGYSTRGHPPRAPVCLGHGIQVSRIPVDRRLDICGELSHPINPPSSRTVNAVVHAHSKTRSPGLDQKFQR